MLRLKGLGGLAVLQEGAVLKGAATQRRRLTLLAIIAVAGKKGISRDRLLTLLWPDSGETQGRHGLAQSLYALRRDLGNDQLFLGTTELRLNPAAISSDVEDFREAVAAGELCRAASIYQGPLLDGVYISGAPDFERWLDGERESLAREFSGALEALAMQQREKGDIGAAAATLARLFAHDPLNKRVVVKSIQAMADAGDLAGALAQADRHETERHDALDMPADAEVLSLRASIANAAREKARSFPEAAYAEPSFAAEIPSGETSSVVEVPAIAARAGSHPRAKFYWIGAAAAVAIAGSVITQRALSADTGSSVESRIAVMPFAVRGNERLAYLHNGMVDLLSQRLDGAGAIHTVDPNALLDFIRQDSASEPDLANAQIAASHFGAGKFIVGSIVDAGGRIQISATIYDASGKRLSVANSFAADESHLLPVIDDLARGLVGGELNDTDARIGREAALSTASLPALKAFLAGEQESRAAHYPAAVESYQRSVRLDSTFALAWYRLSTAADWSSQSALVSDAIRAAVRFESKLSAEERMLLDARMASLTGDDDEAERLYHSILVSHPEDAEAWMQLGETVFHNGGWRGRPIGESRAAFERVAALRASDASSRLHLARLAALRNDRVALDTLTPSAISLSSDAEQVLELNAIAALGSSDDVRAEKFVRGLERASPGVSQTDEAIRLAAWRVATFTTDPFAAQRLALILTRTGNPAATRLSGFLAAAHMAAARGRWNESRGFLDAANQLDHAASLRARANLLASGIFPAKSGEIRELIDALRQLPANGKNPRASKLIDEAIAGRLATMIHDSVSAQQSMRAIESAFRADSSLALIAIHLKNQIDARAKLVAGNTTGALASSESGWPAHNPMSRYPWLQSEAYTMAAGRFLRARLLDESGRVADALPWYETIAEDQGYGTAYLAPSYLRRAVAEEKLHLRDPAVEHYTRFIALWRDADPALQPQVRFAQARLKGLTSSK